MVFHYKWHFNYDMSYYEPLWVHFFCGLSELSGLVFLFPSPVGAVFLRAAGSAPSLSSLLPSNLSRAGDQPTLRALLGGRVLSTSFCNYLCPSSPHLPFHRRVGTESVHPPGSTHVGRDDEDGRL